MNQYNVVLFKARELKIFLESVQLEKTIEFKTKPEVLGFEVKQRRNTL